MTNETGNLILEYLRKFEKTLADVRVGMYDMREELQGMNRRLSHREEGQALINQRLDRFDARVMRIEKHLDLGEG